MHVCRMCGWCIFTCTYAYVPICLMDTLVCLSKEMSPPLYASGNGANFLQLKTEIEATVLTHFTLVYFRLSPHTCSRAQREERPPELGSRGATLEWKLALPSRRLRIWLQNDSISELIVPKTRNSFDPNVTKNETDESNSLLLHPDLFWRRSQGLIPLWESRSLSTCHLGTLASVTILTPECLSYP